MTPILISSSLKYSDIRAELMPDVLPDRSEVAKFDQTKLKHVKTTEKVVLPTQDGEAEIFLQYSYDYQVQTYNAC